MNKWPISFPFLRRVCVQHRLHLNWWTRMHFILWVAQKPTIGNDCFHLLLFTPSGQICYELIELEVNNKNEKLQDYSGSSTFYDCIPLISTLFICIAILFSHYHCCQRATLSTHFSPLEIEMNSTSKQRRFCSMQLMSMQSHCHTRNGVILNVFENRQRDEFNVSRIVAPLNNFYCALLATLFIMYVYWKMGT